VISNAQRLPSGNLVPPLSCTEWLERLDRSQDGWPDLFRIYGNRPDLVRQKVRLIRAGLFHFLSVHGNLSVRVYRAPGRINLRGMHVDTHGGWLNLQTHHRETLVAAAKTDDPVHRYANGDPAFTGVEFTLTPYLDRLASVRQRHTPDDPAALLELADIQAGSGLPSWGRYALGTALTAIFHGSPPDGGLRAVVWSDTVQGASLSSSASLCVALTLAQWGRAGMTPPLAPLVHGSRQAEWFAGARVGLSDQGAVALGQPGSVLFTALWGPELFPAPPAWHPFPEDATILILHTFTSRHLSGSRRADYARNRFAYSMALRMLESAAAPLRGPYQPIAFSTFPEVLAAFPDNCDRLRLIANLPDSLDLADLEHRYGIFAVREAYDRLFGDLPPAERPTRFAIRGPVLFGLAETLRAHRFFEALRSNDLERMGLLMRIGHDGDRVTDTAGRPYTVPTDSATIREWIARNRPLEECPGAYGASTPTLDRAVDTATQAGAVGACLTGAGMGGAALALCRKTDAEAIRESIARCLASDDFQRLRGRDAQPWPEDAAQTAVEENIAVAGAGILPPPA